MIDQLAHALISGCPLLLVLLWPTLPGAALAGALILAVREVEQARENVEEAIRHAVGWRDRYRAAQTQVLEDLRKPDRWLDVLGGAAGGAIAYELAAGILWLRASV